MATPRSFETFGLDTPTSWAEPVLNVLFNTPRLYEPLAEAWAVRVPTSRSSLETLTDAGFVAFQPALVYDTVTRLPASSASRQVIRRVITSAGRRALADAQEDIATFEDRFPNTPDARVPELVELLSAFNLAEAHARYGLSVSHAAYQANLDERTARRWITTFEERRWLRTQNTVRADVRELIPAHWRVTRHLTRHLRELAVAFNRPELTSEFRLGRKKFLSDIDPARVGVTGATDYDHDITAQRIVAGMLASPRWLPTTPLRIEPRIILATNNKPVPQFTPGHGRKVFYQPDAELRIQSPRPDGSKENRRIVVEYERYQSRRSAWSHLERFYGYLHAHTLGFEAATLLFVTDTKARRRTYLELIEAFADHITEHAEWAVPNPVTLAVATVAELDAASDPLSPAAWARIEMTRGADTAAPVLHSPNHSPYDLYFGNAP